MLWNFWFYTLLYLFTIINAQFENITENLDFLGQIS